DAVNAGAGTVSASANTANDAGNFLMMGAGAITSVNPTTNAVSVTVSAGTNGGNMGVGSISATGGTVTLTAAGSITDADANIATLDVTAPSLALPAGTGIGVFVSTTPKYLETSVSNLAATNSTSGDLLIDNNGATLSVTTVGTVTGLSNAGGGGIQLRS